MNFLYFQIVCLFACALCRLVESSNLWLKLHLTAPRPTHHFTTFNFLFNLHLTRITVIIHLEKKKLPLRRMLPQTCYLRMLTDLQPRVIMSTMGKKYFLLKICQKLFGQLHISVVHLLWSAITKVFVDFFLFFNKEQLFYKTHFNQISWVVTWLQVALVEINWLKL